MKAIILMLLGALLCFFAGVQAYPLLGISESYEADWAKALTSMVVGIYTLGNSLMSISVGEQGTHLTR